MPWLRRKKKIIYLQTGLNLVCTFFVSYRSLPGGRNCVFFYVQATPRSCTSKQEKVQYLFSGRKGVFLFLCFCARKKSLWTHSRGMRCSFLVPAIDVDLILFPPEKHISSRQLVDSKHLPKPKQQPTHHDCRQLLQAAPPPLVIPGHIRLCTNDPCWLSKRKSRDPHCW